MIHIENNSEIIENKNLRVASPTGDYEDTALVDFFDISKPGMVAGSFQAQYIKYGGLVYKFNEPSELGEAILKIDPESTHSAASYVRMSKELLAQMNGGTLDSSSLDQIMVEEKNIVEEPESVIQEPITQDPVVEKPKKSERTRKPTLSSMDGALSTTTPVTTTSSDNIIEDVQSVVEDVTVKAEQISRTAEKISDVVEQIVK